jgi:hypothetical protein
MVVGLVIAGMILLSVVGSFHFFPFFLLFWLVPFVLVPAIVSSVRGVGGLLERRGPVVEERKEKELLEALSRCGEVTPARAALETSLSVSEADRLLSELAKGGHIEVRAHEGRLGYSLWEHDRRELTD